LASSNAEEPFREHYAVYIIADSHVLVKIENLNARPEIGTL